MKLSLKIWNSLLFGFVIVCSSAKFCTRRYVNGKWIANGDCGVFQRRMNGEVDFYRNWTNYEKGFGNREGDYWLGLEELHERTKEGNMELEINMILKDTGIHWVAKYSHFRIGPGSDKYSMRVSGYSGNATWDGLSYHNNLQFSAKHAEAEHSWKCASEWQGGWWFDNCVYSNLNGNFNRTDVKGIWWGWPNLLRFSEMKIRKRL